MKYFEDYMRNLKIFAIQLFVYTSTSIEVNLNLLIKISIFKSHSLNHTVRRRIFFICRKNTRRGIKIRPSLAPERRKMLHDATAILEDYNTTDLKNPPEFVYADMHGNLFVKMSSEANRRMFFTFSSIVELCSLIEKHNQEGRVETI